MSKSYTITSVRPEENKIIVLFKVGNYSRELDITVTVGMTRDDIIAQVKKALDAQVGFKGTQLETELNNLIGQEFVV